MKKNGQAQLDLPRSEHETSKVDAEIQEKQKITDHEIREFPVSVIVDKFTLGLEKCGRPHKLQVRPHKLQLETLKIQFKKASLNWLFC